LGNNYCLTARRVYETPQAFRSKWVRALFSISHIKKDWGIQSFLKGGGKKANHLHNPKTCACTYCRLALNIHQSTLFPP